MSLVRIRQTEIETGVHEKVDGYENDGHIFITDYDAELRIEFKVSVENLDNLIKQLTDLRKEIVVSNSSSLQFITGKKITDKIP